MMKYGFWKDLRSSNVLFFERNAGLKLEEQPRGDTWWSFEQDKSIEPFVITNLTG